MKTLSIRETRAALAKLETLLAKHGRILVSRRGKVVARIEPADAPRALPSLDKMRAAMPFQRLPSETLIRKDRDER